jgi:hypothetical protein
MDESAAEGSLTTASRRCSRYFCLSWHRGSVNKSLCRKNIKRHQWTCRDAKLGQGGRAGARSMDSGLNSKALTDISARRLCMGALQVGRWDKSACFNSPFTPGFITLAVDAGAACSPPFATRRNMTSVKATPAAAPPAKEELMQDFLPIVN